MGMPLPLPVSLDTIVTGLAYLCGLLALYGLVILLVFPSVASSIICAPVLLVLFGLTAGAGYAFMFEKDTVLEMIDG